MGCTPSCQSSRTTVSPQPTTSTRGGGHNNASQSHTDSSSSGSTKGRRCSKTLRIAKSIVSMYKVHIEVDDEHRPGVLQEECCICLAPMSPREASVASLDLVVLPCQHGFHEECLLSWLTKQLRCPLCCAELSPTPTDGIFSAGGDTVTGSGGSDLNRSPTPTDTVTSSTASPSAL